MIYRKLPILLFASLLGCFGGVPGEDSQTPGPDQLATKLDPVVLEAARLIRDAVLSCENKLANGWKENLDQFVDKNWNEIEAALPLTTPVKIGDGKLTAYDEGERHSQSYELPSGEQFHLGITGVSVETTYAKLEGVFSFLNVEVETLEDFSTIYTSHFQCSVHNEFTLIFNTESESNTDATTKFEVAGDPKEPKLELKLQGPAPVKFLVTACLDGKCETQSLDENLSLDLVQSLSGKTIDMGLYPSPKNSPSLETLVLNEATARVFNAIR